MSYLRSDFHHPLSERNALGYTRHNYEGPISTLCAGCGHDSISAAIVQACFELSLPPHRIAKISGIGCSSNTPSYVLEKSHGFNSVHGRMPSVATGANVANRDLVYIGVSGDGDSASIGMGQFAHVIRRNLNMLYVVENNGCYGLTKGQDSATTDLGSHSKKGLPSPYQGIDLCGLALEVGAGFVARGFSGDKEQLVPLIKAGLRHPGFALLDILSPCVTFNNNEESTKSYSFAREYSETATMLDFVPESEEITVQYAPGTTRTVRLHDGARLVLHKQQEDYDPCNREDAERCLHEASHHGSLLTGLLYIKPDSRDLHALIGTSHRPLNSLSQQDLCPGPQALEKINTAAR